ncbi:MAG: nucleotidyltransferase domain-containing protein [Candidatus Omnitrophica bacterium]|nr:nucleotidyltransferase domain-containing protein [Candidatus Omnitrophota bacterium]
MKKNPFEKIINQVKSDPQILAVMLFGSVARGENLVGSDVDLCFILQPGEKQLQDMSQKRLDYLADFLFDIHIFQQLPIYIQKRVIGEGQVIFCRDDDSLYDVAFKMIREYSDFEHIYRDYLEEVSHG